MTTNERTVGRYLCWLLAALSAGAAFIHFAVSGEHYDLSWLHGSFFAAIAWLQLAFAVGVVLRPNRRLLVAGVVLNAGIIGVWAMSRPSKTIRPVAALTSPEMVRSVVVFPAPLDPIRATISPLSTERLIPRRACTRP